MTTATLEKILHILRKEIKKWKVPVVGVIADEAIDRPFETLVSCLLSLRTKDAVTDEASRRLLGRASTPETILGLSSQEIEKLIYPVGFYRTKAKNLHKICQILMDQYDGRVPDSLEHLLALPGVGRKTANLVMTVGHDKYGICVDTHVHRISNIWGYVKTKTPEETEFALRKKLPKKYWKTYNDILVTFGQNLCVPVSPWCSRCPVESYCKKIGVKRWR
ncbi:MAG: endonuclease III [Deltaproteobacteria bacterium]|nr:endonuclease III [Deltaproteobacteria bacterium]